MAKTRSADTTAKVAAPRGKEAQAANSRKLVLLQSVLAILILGGMWWLWDTILVPRLGINRVHLHSMADRMTWTLRHQLLGLIAIAISILHVSLTRASTLAINPLAGQEHLVEKANRILTNTIEQYILSAGNQLILATHLPEAHLKIIPLISITFLIGRVLFLAGYLNSPNHRGLGFVITFLPTIGALGYNIWFTATLGYVHHLGAATGSRM
jgi:uncharacterized membrane protein YecN with MAPEG domain